MKCIYFRYTVQWILTDVYIWVTIIKPKHRTIRYLYPWVTTKDIEQIRLPLKVSCPTVRWQLVPHPWPQATIDLLLCPYVILVFVKFSINKIIPFIVFCPSSLLNVMFLKFIHVVWIRHFLPLCGITVDVPQYVYTFTCWCILGLFSVFWTKAPMNSHLLFFLKILSLEPILLIKFA